MIKQIKKILKKTFSSNDYDIIKKDINETISVKRELRKHYDLEDKKPHVGFPAPVYLKDDEWFGAAPGYTENQKDYMEKETEIKRQELEQKELEQIFPVESEYIHQKMYEIAIKSQKTTVHLNPPGGSENFHGASNGWMSGAGIN
jgi:hypothetical protein